MTIVAGAVLTGWLGLSPAHAQTTGQVYQLTMSASGDYTHKVSSNVQTVASTPITTATMINTAMGRVYNATVPANQVLAVALFFPPDGGNPTGGIVVWDTAGHSNLVSIVDFGMIGGAIASKTGKGYIAMAGGINAVGGFSNGWLAVSGSATAANPESNTPTITAFKGSALQGELIGTNEDSFDLLITKGSLTLIGSLGNWIMPPAPE